MADLQIESFLNHFKLLWGAGEEASLKIESKLGEISLSLSCKVGRIAPPSPVPSQAFNSREKYRSPSYFRRQDLCRAAHEAQNISSVDVSTLTDNAGQALTERFLDSVVADEAEVSNAAGGANGGVAEVETVPAAENILEHAIEDSGYGQLSDESSKSTINLPEVSKVQDVNGVGGTTGFTCSLCDSWWLREGDFKAHMKNRHRKEAKNAMDI